MSQAVQWIKSNPVMLVAAVVAALALGYIAYVLFIGGESVAKTIGGQEAPLRQIQSLQRQSISLPPNRPGGRPEPVSGITINPQTVRDLQKINDSKANEFRRTVAEIRARQQVRRGGDNPHQLFYQGKFQQDKIPSVFQTTVKNDLLALYTEVFEDWLKPPGEGTAPGPRLNAGTPPTAAALQAVVDAAREAFLERFGTGIMGGAAVELSEEQREQAEQELTSAWLLAVEQRAQSIDIYVGGDVVSAPGDSLPGERRRPTGLGEFGPGPAAAPAAAPASRPRLPMPFDVDPIDPSRPLDPSRVWERQMEIWIQQDVARVIELVNRPAEPGSYVTSNPIKHLIRVEVQPGYVGLHTAGAVDGAGQVITTARQAGVPGSDETAAYSAPAGATYDVNGEPLVGNYNVAFTGRVSNPLFDVRHVYVKMIVDMNQLPPLWAAIQQVGFQTVVDFELTDVDEYEALRSGYFYGVNVDAWELELVIESLWLRDALVEWMPPTVRQYLGIQEEGATAPTDGTPAGPAPERRPTPDREQFEGV